MLAICAWLLWNYMWQESSVNQIETNCHAVWLIMHGMFVLTLTVTWGNPHSGHQSLWYPRACLSTFPLCLCWDESYHKSGPRPSVMGNLLLILAPRAGKKVWPCTPIQHCVGACGFWQEGNFYIFSQKVCSLVMQKQASLLPGAWAGERCHLCSSGCRPTPHRADSHVL